jgi:predicted nucleotide-binding protein
MNEKINQSMTLLENFEKYSDQAGFADILMTPDDYGYLKDDEQNKRLRARQNVIFELGYFFARLTKYKTFVLKKGGDIRNAL